MKKVIWKYQIDNPDNQVFLPEGAEVLDVQVQNGQLMLWALVDPEKKKTNRMFRVFATGEDIHAVEKFKYVGTFQKGWFVGHVFEWIGQ